MKKKKIFGVLLDECGIMYVAIAGWRTSGNRDTYWNVTRTHDTYPYFTSECSSVSLSEGCQDGSVLS
jgi:hypothetical protein